MFSCINIRLIYHKIVSNGLTELESVFGVLLEHISSVYVAAGEILLLEHLSWKLHLNSSVTMLEY